MSLSTEDLVLFLCLHNGGKHYWLVLRWLCDLAELLRCRAEEIRWRELFERARKAGVERLLAIGLILAREVLEVPLSCDCCELAYRDKRAGDLAKRLKLRLVSTSPVDREDTALDRCALYFRMRERVRDRLLYLPHLAGRFFTPTKRDRSLLDVKGALSLVYLMIRPVRLALRFGAIAAGRTAARSAARREGRQT